MRRELYALSHPFSLPAALFNDPNVTVPSLDDILELRANPQAFEFTMMNFTCHVVGKKDFFAKVADHDISKFVTASNETWAIMTLINQWDCWEAEAAGTKMEDLPKAVYTSEEASGRNIAWSKDGLEHMAEVFNDVLKDCKLKKHKKVEVALRKKIAAEQQEANAGKKKKKATEDFILPSGL